MSFVIRGPSQWSMTRDAEGHREYKLTTEVESQDYSDGPATALLTPGLPLVGSPWFLGNDVDFWAWCRWDATVTPKVTKEPNRFFIVEQKFSTRPIDRPNDSPIENPLMEPPKVSGSYLKIAEEATHDRFGIPLINSAFEKITGPKAEFDVTRSTIRIEQNFAALNFPLQEMMQNCVNDSPLWLMPARTIKLSGIAWEKKYHGYNNYYYTRVLDFEVCRAGWDRVIMDSATKVLHGRWTSTGAWELVNIDGAAPSESNPSHFMKAIDRKGNECSIILNGRGVPASVSITNATDLSRIGNYYVSIVNANLGNALTSTANWILQVGGDSFWDSYTTYPIGSIVVLFDVYYIAHAISPPGDAPLLSSNWTSLGSGFRDRGSYVSTTSYSKGDRVQYPLTAPTAIGQKLVSKYPGANFLLLSVPLFF